MVFLERVKGRDKNKVAIMHTIAKLDHFSPQGDIFDGSRNFQGWQVIVIAGDMPQP